MGTLRVSHGTNSILWARMQREGRIIGIRDPLIDRIKGDARELALRLGAREEVVAFTRGAAIYVATNRDRANGKSVGSPGVLLRALKFLRDHGEIESAKRHVESLREQGWFEVSLVRLDIEIRTLGEIGLTGYIALDNDTTIRECEKVGALGMGLSLANLEISRVVNVHELSIPPDLVKVMRDIQSR